MMTGDVTIEPNASCLVMTTEIWRSMLYRDLRLFGKWLGLFLAVSSSSIYWPNRVESVTESFVPYANRETSERQQDTGNKFRLFGIKLLDSNQKDDVATTLNAVDNQPDADSDLHSEPSILDRSDVPSVSCDPDKSCLRSSQESQSRQIRSCTKVIQFPRAPFSTLWCLAVQNFKWILRSICERQVYCFPSDGEADFSFMEDREELRSEAKGKRRYKKLEEEMRVSELTTLKHSIARLQIALSTPKGKTKMKFSCFYKKNVEETKLLIFQKLQYKRLLQHLCPYESERRQSRKRRDASPLGSKIGLKNRFGLRARFDLRY